MNKAMKTSLLGAGIFITLAASVYAGTTYDFTVSCPDKHFVAEWRVGDVDPGKEALRVSTGTANPGCSIGDYNQLTDGHLPKDISSGAPAVWKGIPFIGPILCHIFC
ncbi:hypothetical protein QN397_19690 [Variovorax sp. RTB1]|uniref:hypothetical protein n=1 Tax=Variovorax sp. RTB1 TaxID=3048631 RepID=UPI002B225A67|nr:hypothetical protein [Variovorax sp. RTB1]MEB0113534.1 hypothetical protein [Variovorax sp. RTB1]